MVILMGMHAITAQILKMSYSPTLTGTVSAIYATTAVIYLTQVRRILMVMGSVMPVKKLHKNRIRSSSARLLSPPCNR